MMLVMMQLGREWRPGWRRGFIGYGYGYGYEDCRGHPGAPPIRYNAYSTLSGSTMGRCVLVRLCHSLPRAPPVRRAAACLES